MAPRALSICLSIIRWAPVIFITAVIVWSYYAYVIQLCLFTVESIAEKVVYLIIYHPLLIMFLWAYWQTIFTDPGKVPREFFLNPGDAERLEREENEDVQKDLLVQFSHHLPVQCVTAAGSVRYCDRCKCVKPDRAHHCSVCGRCILKMDHHCPWVNNCVNFTNYKFFVLFLAYALMYCLYVAATTFQYFIQFWTTIRGSSKSGLNNLHILFLFFASIMFAISVLFLFCYHVYLTLSNRSTLETFRAPIFRSGPDKNGFSLGYRGNWAEVFGDNAKTWFLPIFSSLGDGATYPTNVGPNPTYNSMDNTVTIANVESTVNASKNGNSVPDQQITIEQPASFGDGVNFPVRTVDEDYDSLLGQRQRWMEDGEAESGEGYENMTAKM